MAATENSQGITLGKYDEIIEPLFITMPTTSDKEPSHHRRDEDNNEDRELMDLSGTWVNRGYDSSLDLLQGPFGLTRSIPPDPMGAVGPTSLIAVTNVEIEGRDKATGNLLFGPSYLLDMFAAGGIAAVRVFDPKIIYDTHEDRFVIVVLGADRTTSTIRDSAILIAVSKTSNPRSTGPQDWWFHSIETTLGPDPSLGLDEECWADYPGLEVDEEAVYITNNMFATDTSSGSFEGSLLWILNKNEYYNANFADSSSFSLHDFISEAGAGFPTTHMPAVVRAPDGIGGSSSGIGTFLVAYSGLSDGVGVDYVQVVQVNDPLTNPSFNQTYVPIGDIEDRDIEFPHAPQLGSPNRILTNDRRALDAAWHDDYLWLTSTLVNDQGVVNSFWVRLNADGVNEPTLDTIGLVNGDQIAPGATTFMASIDVSPLTGHAAIGFAASAPTIYAGAYAIIVEPDGITVNGPPDVVKEGQDDYFITFGGTRNRWGDYTGMAWDPTDPTCFWAFNEYASFSCYSTFDGQDGCWSTAWARLCSDNGVVNPDPTTSPTLSPVASSPGNTIVIPSSVWQIPQNGGPLPPITNVRVGDTLRFEWSRTHEVWIHPSGTCDQRSRISVGFQSGATYVIQDSDAGTTLTFACDVGGGSHCDLGMIMNVTVAPNNAGGVTSSPTQSPTRSPTTESPTPQTTSTTESPTPTPQTTPATESPTPLLPTTSQRPTVQKNNVPVCALCFMSSHLSWNMANVLAQKFQCNLASIETARERLTVALELEENILTEKFWTGGYYDSTLDTWEWMDGSSFSGQHWGKHQPNSLSEYGALTGNVTYVTIGTDSEGTAVLYDESSSAAFASVWECCGGCPDFPMIN